MEEPQVPSSGIRPRIPFALWVCSVLILLVGIAHSTGLSGPFFFDDIPAIVQNEHLESFTDSLILRDYPAPLSRRPLSSLSLAVNRAIGGVDPWGYHFLNLVLHAVSTVVLHGLVRRTVVEFDQQPGIDTRWFPAVVAAVWGVHPLTSEVISYAIQRTEGLVSLFYLLTLYSAVRAWNDSGWFWRVSAWLTCFAGMACKEVMVTAPVCLILYDLTFRLGALRQRWRERVVFYGPLLLSWVVLALLLRNRSYNAFPGIEDAWANLQIQAWAITRYLLLAVRPVDLSVDYGGVPGAKFAIDPRVGLVVVAITFVIAGLGWWRSRPIGFCVTAFLLVLSPTSSIIPLGSEFAAERRVYLPLAFLVPGLLGALSVLWHGMLVRIGGSSTIRITATVPIVLAGVVLLTVLSRKHNAEYLDQEQLWKNAVRIVPFNQRALAEYARLVLADGRPRDAVEIVRSATDRQPDNPFIWNARGLTHALMNDLVQALECYDQAERLQPDLSETMFNKGQTLVGLQRFAEARPYFEKVTETNPEDFDSHYNLGQILAKENPKRAIVHLQRAVELGRSGVFALGGKQRNALETLAMTQHRLGRHDAAAEAFLEAIALSPKEPQLVNNLGVTLLTGGRVSEAVRALRAGRERHPGFVPLKLNLARALLLDGKLQEAVAESRASVQIAPRNPGTWTMFGDSLTAAGEPETAARAYEAALSLDSRNEAARRGLDSLRSARSAD